MNYTSLDKKSSEPLYLQIRRMVLQAIRMRDLLPGQRVPSAFELSENSGVSRMTVRQALQALIDEGWLYTVPGKGTFVAERPHIEQNLQHLKGWTDEIREQGMQASTRLVSVTVVPADRSVAMHLAIPPGTPVHCIERARYADNFPLALERAHLVQERFPGLGELIQMKNASLYKILRQTYGVSLVRAVQFLEAGEVGKAVAKLLDLHPSSPALISERITYDEKDSPIEYVYGISRPGFVRYKTEMSAGSASVRQIIILTEKESADGDPTGHEEESAAA